MWPTHETEDSQVQAAKTNASLKLSVIGKNLKSELNDLIFIQEVLALTF